MDNKVGHGKHEKIDESIESLLTLPSAFCARNKIAPVTINAQKVFSHEFKSSGICDRIEHKFLMSGHNFSASDGDFALIVF
ncbi:hypothetical protein C0J52_27852 [Blattella germanica]|nr:hypothetical protein C0J52_27852 [Blattella germanica]